MGKSQRDKGIKYTEADVKRAVREYLDAKKYLYVPVQNQGQWIAKKRIYAKFSGTKGAPDLMVMDQHGDWLCIELKSSTGKQSKHQCDFEHKVNLGSGKYFVVRSIDDLINAGL
jgi:hypothetical protein